MPKHTSLVGAGLEVMVPSFFPPAVPVPTCAQRAVCSTSCCNLVAKLPASHRPRGSVEMLSAHHTWGLPSLTLPPSDCLPSPNPTWNPQSCCHAVSAPSAMVLSLSAALANLSCMPLVLNPHARCRAVSAPSAMVLSPDHRKHFLSTLIMLITGESPCVIMTRDRKSVV